MTDAFWIALFTAVPPTLAALAALVVSLRNSAKAKANAVQIEEVKQAAVEARTEIVAKVAAVHETATRSLMEVSQAFMAGERSGYVGGIQEGKKQNTGPAPLGK